VDTITNFISSKEVISACLFIITIFSAYHTWKFRTYGQIEAKLAKLPKLSEIEHAIENAKNSSEFEFHQRKEDLGRLMEFAKKTSLVTSKIKKISEECINNALELHRRCGEDSDGFTIANYLKNNRQIDNTEINSLIDEISAMHTIHLEEYEGISEFNKRFYEWGISVSEVSKFNTQFENKIRDNFFQFSDSEKISKNIILQMNERNEKINNIRFPMFEALSNLNKSLSNISKSIKKQNNFA